MSNIKIKQRFDLESAWISQNPVLSAGEIACVQRENGEIRIKIGKSDSGQASRFNDLEYLKTNTYFKDPSMSPSEYSGQLSVVKLPADEYYQKVVDGDIDPYTLYILSADTMNAYGMQIKNAAEPTEPSDVATKMYVDTHGGSGDSRWGNILGDIRLQTDLQQALAGKADSSSIGSGQLVLRRNGAQVAVFGANQTNGVTADIAVPAAANNGALTIRQNGTVAATFGADSASNTTADIAVDYQHLAGQAQDSQSLVDYVNSSINNYAAFYTTKNAGGDAFQTYAELTGTTTYYYAGSPIHGDGIPRKNDYCVVLQDETQTTQIGVDPTTRYTWQQQDGQPGRWEFQYIVNNTSLTTGQINAINSGIDSALVAQIQANKQDCIVIHGMIDGIEEQINAL